MDSTHVMLTSRPLKVIERAMHDMGTAVLELTASAVQQDIETYVQISVADMATERKWPKALTAEVEATLIAGANGM